MLINVQPIPMSVNGMLNLYQLKLVLMKYLKYFNIKPTTWSPQWSAFIFRSLQDFFENVSLKFTLIKGGGLSMLGKDRLLHMVQKLQAFLFSTLG